VVFKDPNWDYRKFNFDTDIIADEKLDNGLLNALDPNRLFMVPGMAHCGGGEGPNEFDLVSAIRTMGREGQGARPHYGVAPHRRQSRSHASAVPLPAGLAVQGEREYRRGRQFHV